MSMRLTLPLLLCGAVTLLLAGALVWLLATDVPVKQTSISKTIPNERFFNGN